MPMLFRSPLPSCCRKTIGDSVGRRNITISTAGISTPSLNISTEKITLISPCISFWIANTLRNIIGDLELDQCLTSRDLINGKMRTILDEATDPWGIKVNRVELKNILPPREIQSAMEKQMKAERERREAILRAEGEKRAAILEAEGEKESAILRADAKKQQQILEAEGEAEAILKVQTATAEGIRLINESMPSDAVLKIKALEAFAAAANGKATKIIIPSEIQGIAGLAEGVVQSVKDVPADKAE